MIDAHAHLRAPPPAPSSPMRAEPRTELWVVPGIDAARDAEARGLAAQDARLRCAVGLHPWFLPDSDDALDAALADLALRAALPGVVAVGETGLDKRRPTADERAARRSRQERAFRAQIALAQDLDLPLILHVVGGHGACLRALRDQRFPPGLGGMVHDFGGPLETIAEWAAAGFCLSISPRSLSADRVPLLRAIPDALLLAETDDFGPERLLDVLAALAAARGISLSAVAALTAANARRCLRLG